MLATLAAIGWEPEIRGALVVLLSVAILCGSVYLILATNTGISLGFLQAFTGLMGWMLIMGVIWWIYGIGLIGEAPTWQVEEVAIGDVGAAEVESVRTLPEGWRTLPEGDGDRGEAQAAVEEFMRNNPGLVEAESTVTVGAFSRGGKDRLEGSPACSIHRPGTYDGCWDRIEHKIGTSLTLTHPTHRAVIQVQPADEDGEAVTSEPVANFVLVRDLGNRRFPPAMVTLASGILFAIGASQLHRRDKMAMAARAAAGV